MKYFKSYWKQHAVHVKKQAVECLTEESQEQNATLLEARGKERAWSQEIERGPHRQERIVEIKVIARINLKFWPHAPCWGLQLKGKSFRLSSGSQRHTRQQSQILQV